jgi:pimeloyl-ACP methyl ester carboxylesterase
MNWTSNGHIEEVSAMKDYRGPNEQAPCETAVRQPRRGRRRLRRAAITVVLLLAMAGAASIQRFFFGRPGVGHFRSLEGRAAYVDAYGRGMSALPSPTATHDVVTDLGTVHAYEWSPPEQTYTVPVVLIPGRTSGVPMWSENLPGFLKDHRVIAFDALGDAGLSVQGSPMESLEDQALWIEQVLAELAPSGAHLVGHSFGGATAATYAQRSPDRVVSLTLLEPVFTFAYPPTRLMGWAMLSSLPRLPDRLRNYALGKVGGVEYDPKDDMAKMIAAGSKHFSASLPQPAPLDDDQLRELTMPTYVAIADRDSLAGGGAAVDRARLLPHGTVEVWSDATHSLPMQAKDKLDSRLKDFWVASEPGA